MERSKVSPGEASDDYSVLANLSTKILPSLFKLVESFNELSSKEMDDEMDMDAASSS